MRKPAGLHHSHLHSDPLTSVSHTCHQGKISGDVEILSFQYIWDTQVEECRYGNVYMNEEVCTLGTYRPWSWLISLEGKLPFLLHNNILGFLSSRSNHFFCSFVGFCCHIQFVARRPQIGNGDLGASSLHTLSG